VRTENAVTRQSLIEKTQVICAKAIEAGQLSAATAAVKEIGVLSGIRIERSERGQPGEFDWVDKLSVNPSPRSPRWLSEPRQWVPGLTQNDIGVGAPLRPERLLWHTFELQKSGI
jgi:hypothetical protein